MVLMLTYIVLLIETSQQSAYRGKIGNKTNEEICPL